MKIKQIWTQEEDQYLKLLVQMGKSDFNWIQLAQRINERFSYKTKTTKQCEQRFNKIYGANSNSHSMNDWTQQQTQALFFLFLKWGSRWTKISQQFKGKSQNSVKNRFYGSLRKTLRKINRALVKKLKKQVKYKSITRIIDAAQGLFRLQSPLKEESQTLTKKIFGLAKINQEEMLAEQAEELIVQINKFNMATRSYKSKKKAKNDRPSENMNMKQTCRSKKQTRFCNSKQNSEAFGQNSYMQHQEHNNKNIEEGYKNNQKLIKQQDGLIDFMQFESVIQKQTKNHILDLDILLSQFQSPLQCEAWI